MSLTNEQEDWNKYPGARVDSQYPIYALSIPEVYQGWRWKEEYPGHEELREYFKHVDDVLEISKDTMFGERVIRAAFDSPLDKWQIECKSGLRITTRFFLPCMGFAARRHFPEWPGLDAFQGTICHSSFWPKEGIDVRGKRVAVVGTGATGIQIAQTTARDCDHLTLFQRTPNLCLPMRQTQISPERAERDMAELPGIMNSRYNQIAGFLYQAQPIQTFDHSPDEREAFFQKLWDIGGFRMLANNYSDMLADRTANQEAYDFWVKRTRTRISDPIKRDLLAPEVPPHPFGGKRMSLEQDFYEQMDKPHVDIVSIRDNPVDHVVPEGIVTADGKLRKFDIIAIATGFDSFTGGLKDIKITGLNDTKLNDKWAMGTYTYLGMTVANFPNFFFLYGPQAPTAYANGPSITEPQGEWVTDVLKRMREAGKTRINATREAELEWKEQVNTLHKRTLRNEVDSWYMGKFPTADL